MLSASLLCVVNKLHIDSNVRFVWRCMPNVCKAMRVSTLIPMRYIISTLRHNQNPVRRYYWEH